MPAALLVFNSLNTEYSCMKNIYTLDATYVNVMEQWQHYMVDTISDDAFGNSGCQVISWYDIDLVRIF